MNLPVFIIPTVGRASLGRAIVSLLRQRNKQWKALVVGDGIQPSLDRKDSRIRAIKIAKAGVGKNGAGQVRNQGMKWWMDHFPTFQGYFCFLDDDDTLCPSYVSLVYHYREQTSKKAILFRMNHPRLGILPPPGKDKILSCKVGISFAIHSSLFLKGHCFEPSKREDFFFLKDLEKSGEEIYFAKEVVYLVRSSNKVKGTIKVKPQKSKAKKAKTDKPKKTKAKTDKPKKTKAKTISKKKHYLQKLLNK